MNYKSPEADKWNIVKEYIGENNITLGPYFSYQLMNTPRHILFTLSHYKFAAKLLGESKRILEVGCSEGLGTVILAEFAKKVVAVDIDGDAIEHAHRNFTSERVEFLNLDFLGAKFDKFDGIVSFDVIEHIYPENEDLFFSSICNNLSREGICIIGTPNETSDQYASKVTRMGHVNLYSWERLRNTINKYFDNVFLFSANDEVVHTGFYPMAQYLIADVG